jgi:hypothetical protein
LLSGTRHAHKHSSITVFFKSKFDALLQRLKAVPEDLFDMTVLAYTQSAACLKVALAFEILTTKAPSPRKQETSTA